MLHLERENSPATSKMCTFNYLNSRFPALLFKAPTASLKGAYSYSKEQKKEKKKKKDKVVINS